MIRHSLHIERLEDRTVPANLVAVAPTSGGGPITIYDTDSGARTLVANPFMEFTGPVNVAMGELTGDGIPDLVLAAGVGGGPRVVAIDGSSRAIIRDFFAYDLTFRGGTSVTVFDVTRDTIADIIVGAGPGGGPHVKVIDGSTFKVIKEFFVFDAGFSGGVSVAAGNVSIGPFTNVSQLPAIVVGAGPGGGPNVRVFNASNLDPATTPSMLADFMAFDTGFRGGVKVAVGDVSISNFGPEIIVGAGPGGGPNVKAFNVSNGTRVVADFFAYDINFRGGVNVAARSTATILASQLTDIFTGPGQGGGPRLRGFNFAGQRSFETFFASTDSDTGITVG